MRRCPSSTRCRAAACPPRKLVDPTLTMSREGMFIGSITTSGSRSRARAAISSCPSSSVTAITARRPLTARLRAQVAASAFADGRWSTGFTPMVTATPSSAAVAATPWTISEE